MSGWSWANVIAFITSTGIISGLTNLGVTWIREKGALKASKQASAEITAIRLATLLEAFALNSYTALGLADDDLETFMNSKARTPPFPAYPEDLDWKALGPRLTERAWALSNHHLAEDLATRGAEDFDLYVLAELQALRLIGARAWVLARDIRRAYGLTEDLPYRKQGEWLLDYDAKKTKEEEEAALRPAVPFPWENTSEAQTVAS